MSQSKFITVKGVLRICGDYCAWHEASVYCEWIFGTKYNYQGDLTEAICEKNDLSWDDYKLLTIPEQDTLAEKVVESDDGDYCDMEVFDILVEVSDGKIINKFMKV